MIDDTENGGKKLEFFQETSMNSLKNSVAKFKKHHSSSREGLDLFICDEDDVYKQRLNKVMKDLKLASIKHRKMLNKSELEIKNSKLSQTRINNTHRGEYPSKV